MSALDWVGVAGLGAFHGINPAMGWLFAVAIGLQERSRRALLLALVPIAIGHAVAIGLTVLLVEELRVLTSTTPVTIAGAVLLALLAARQFLRSHRHPRWVGMRLRPRELALWSFVMSTAHGAGMMLVPFVLGIHVAGHGTGVPAVSGLLVAGAVVAVHVLAMALVAGAVAFGAFEWAGVGFLRRGWINLDRLWAYALAVGAAATLVLG
jgi:hypothetical protein